MDYFTLRGGAKGDFDKISMLTEKNISWKHASRERYSKCMEGLPPPQKSNGPP